MSKHIDDLNLEKEDCEVEAYFLYSSEIEGGFDPEDSGPTTGNWPKHIETSLGNCNPLMQVSIDDSRACYRQLGSDTTLTVIYG